jgi:hypothetical protein
VDLITKDANIRGISRTSLWSAWKQIRRDLNNSSVRDVADFLDYDIAPDVWINTLLRQIRTGRYEPGAPYRFCLGKGNGFSRTMTLPNIPDLVLYRTIAEFIYLKVRGREFKHVYFRRAKLAAAQREAERDARETMGTLSRYSNSAKGQLNWLKFNQYRKQLLLDQVHSFLVVTDVSNFFDSLLHSHVEESLRGVTVPPRMLGLLFYLLERLSIRQDYTSSHAISLPVDEFDCSRTLAHIVLFSHDQHMVSLVGEDSYVRWMDDQNMGVATKAAGLKALAMVGSSLSKIHLTPNTKKSQVLSLSQARRHFHLDFNNQLDRAEVLWKEAIPLRDRQRNVRRAVRRLWGQMQPYEGVGEFEKVLKRLYRIAGLANARILRRRAASDVLSKPELVARVAAYMRASGTNLEYLRWVETVMNSEEQVYENVTVELFESLLLVEASGFEARQIRTIAGKFLSAGSKFVGNDQCRSIAPLIYLRFGDRRSLPFLKKVLERGARGLSAPVTRSLGLVIASFGKGEFRFVRRMASRLFNNQLSTLVLMIEALRNYPEVPERYRTRLRTQYNSTTGRAYVDMRGVLTGRLLLLNEKPKVRTWIHGWKDAVERARLSAFDRKLLKKLIS